MENILTHEEVSKEEAKQRAIDLLAEVGILVQKKLLITIHSNYQVVCVSVL